MGGQLVLEGLQRCLAYCNLRELVPQDDGSWEEALLVDCRTVFCALQNSKSKMWLIFIPYYWFNGIWALDVVNCLLFRKVVANIKIKKSQKRQKRTVAGWTCKKWRNTSCVGEMLDELEWPSLEARREQSSLLLFHKVHC